MTATAATAPKALQRAVRQSGHFLDQEHVLYPIHFQDNLILKIYCWITVKALSKIRNKSFSKVKHETIDIKRLTNSNICKIPYSSHSIYICILITSLLKSQIKIHKYHPYKHRRSISIQKRQLVHIQLLLKECTPLLLLEYSPTPLFLEYTHATKGNKQVHNTYMYVSIDLSSKEKEKNYRRHHDMQIEGGNSTHTTQTFRNK